jgi:beta-glucuronidase
MPVPASYNDITQDASIRDHIGDVWYEKEFYVPSSWKEQRVILRVDSATHHAVMWVNGIEAARHKGGYMPFEADVSGFISYGAKNRVILAVNNVLDWTTIHPGNIKTFMDDKHPADHRVQEYYHDFFNYAGIHRPVMLYTTPKTYIKDVTVATDIDKADGVVNYETKAEGSDYSKIKVELYDREDNLFSTGEGSVNSLTVKNARLWEPGNAYLYKMVIKLIGSSEQLVDSYELNVGIRTIRVTDKEFLINERPFYFKGFGKHEDADIRGKGLDHVINIKDFNLLKWIGANSFRTSHYPYAEEIMDLADREGFVVIDECPAVGFNFWNSTKVFSEEYVGSAALEHHIEVMKELIQRDKNHPCVVMWSVANEATTYEEGAVPYFKTIADLTRKLDSTRPITIVQSSQPDNCRVAQFFDIICVNRYYSWYEDPGQLDLIEHQVNWELCGWNNRFNKPVIMSEYGADAISGFHQDPPVMFSEEYQCELLRHYHNVFDRLDFVIGEHVWNFADFATKQGTTRIGGNKKGVFTRQRQPKSSAFLLKERWNKIND